LKRSNSLWENVAHGIRDEYLRRARRGLVAPAEIETELATKNLPPLATRPDPERFDPNSEVWWTLAMTAAWIIWRTPDAVRQAWSNYRREVREWIGPQELFVEYEPRSEYGYRRPMEKVTGYTLEPLRELDLFGVLLRSTLEISRLRTY
jgi:hypothetical protein